MAKLEIKVTGDPILRRKCQPVPTVDRRVRTLLEDMLETMYAAPGVGLAAPQVGVSKRMVVIDVGDGPIRLVNPKLSYLTDEEELSSEGCLSVPGKEGDVWRCTKVKVAGLNERGEHVSYVAEGFFARCVQHELDHLDGRLYTDLAENMRPAGTPSPAEIAQEQAASEVPVDLEPSPTSPSTQDSPQA